MKLHVLGLCCLFVITAGIADATFPSPIKRSTSERKASTITSHQKRPSQESITTKIRAAEVSRILFPFSEQDWLDFQTEYAKELALSREEKGGTTRRLQNEVCTTDGTFIYCELCIPPSVPGAGTFCRSTTCTVSEPPVCTCEIGILNGPRCIWCLVCSSFFVSFDCSNLVLGPDECGTVDCSGNFGNCEEEASTPIPTPLSTPVPTSTAAPIVPQTPDPTAVPIAPTTSAPTPTPVVATTAKPNQAPIVVSTTEPVSMPTVSAPPKPTGFAPTPTRGQQINPFVSEGGSRASNFSLLTPSWVVVASVLAALI